MASVKRIYADSAREVRHADEIEVLAFRERVADAHVP